MCEPFLIASKVNPILLGFCYIALHFSQCPVIVNEGVLEHIINELKVPFCVFMVAWSPNDEKGKYRHIYQRTGEQENNYYGINFKTVQN